MNGLRRHGPAATSDEQLVTRAQAGDPLALDALCARFDETVRLRSLPFDFPGAEKLDVQQEGRIGLLNAVKSWRPGHGTTFKSFAILCIDRHLIVCLKKSLRLKQRALNESLRVATDADGDAVEIVYLIPSPFCRDPVEILVTRERLADLLSAVETLTALERLSMLGVAAGLGYAELCGRIGASEKSIDNANQRARRKLAEAA